MAIGIADDWGPTLYFADTVYEPEAARESLVLDRTGNPYIIKSNKPKIGFDLSSKVRIKN